MYNSKSLIKTSVVLPAILALSLIGCSNDSVKEETKTAPATQKSVEKEATQQVAPEQTAPVVEKSESKEQNVITIPVPSTDEMKASLNTAVSSASKAIQEKTAEIVNEVQTMEMPTKEEVKASVNESMDTASKAVEAASTEIATAVSAALPSSADGKKLYAKCASCHGQKAEKPALGKSQVIAGWDAQKTVDAINGYKDGSYGGPMKALMKGQVSKLTDDEVSALAEYIATLK